MTTLKDAVGEVLDAVTDIDSGLIKDRTRLDEIERKVDGLGTLIKQLYDRLPRTEEKIKNAVADGLAETMQPAIDMVDRLKEASRVITRPQVEQKSIWSKIFRKR